MEKFEVNILGCGAAIPIGRHMTTSQLVNVHDKLFMVDCVMTTYFLTEH